MYNEINEFITWVLHAQYSACSGYYRQIKKIFKLSIQFEGELVGNTVNHLTRHACGTIKSIT